MGPLDTKGRWSLTVIKSIVNGFSLYVHSPSLPYTYRRALEAHWLMHMGKQKSIRMF